MNIEQIARVAHETNRAYCETIGDHSQKSWDQAEPWQRESAIKGVEFALANPGAPASAQHDAWLREKYKAGWTYGPIKDPSKKEHPCMVPYQKLPLDQRIKDHLFRGVCFAFSIAYSLEASAVSAPTASPEQPLGSETPAPPADSSRAGSHSIKV